MKNMLKMIKDASALQKNMKKMKSQLRTITAECSSGSGQVTAVARGDGSVADIRIDASVIDPARREALEKMVLQAVEGALKKARDISAEQVKGLASEMGLPDM